MRGLCVEEVTIRRGGRDVVRDGRMEVVDGQMVAVTGPSGSGKTSLLEVVTGLALPVGGSASLDGQPVWTGTGDPRQEVGFALQEPVLVGVLTIAENVLLAALARNASTDVDARVADALGCLGIGQLGERLVSQVSGGQRQRAALARVLVHRPRLVVVDEPTSALDADSRALVLAELRRCAHDGAVVVVATHDHEVAAGCDRVFTVDDGDLSERAS